MKYAEEFLCKAQLKPALEYWEKKKKKLKVNEVFQIVVNIV